MENTGIKPGKFVPPPGFHEEKLEDTEGPWLEDLENEDVELWIMQTPKNVDLSQVHGKTLSLQACSSFCYNGSLGKQLRSTAIPCGEDGEIQYSLIAPGKSDKKLHMVKKPFAGHILLTETFEVPECKAPSLIHDERADFPKDVKQRYVPFGAFASPLPKSSKQHKKKSKEKRQRKSSKSAAESMVLSASEIENESAGNNSFHNGDTELAFEDHAADRTKPIEDESRPVVSSEVGDSDEIPPLNEMETCKKKKKKEESDSCTPSQDSSFTKPGLPKKKGKKHSVSITFTSSDAGSETEAICDDTDSVKIPTSSLETESPVQNHEAQKKSEAACSKLPDGIVIKQEPLSPTQDRKNLESRSIESEGSGIKKKKKKSKGASLEEREVDNPKRSKYVHEIPDCEVITPCSSAGHGEAMGDEFASCSVEKKKKTKIKKEPISPPYSLGEPYNISTQYTNLSKDKVLIKEEEMKVQIKKEIKEEDLDSCYGSSLSLSLHDERGAHKKSHKKKHRLSHDETPVKREVDDNSGAGSLHGEQKQPSAWITSHELPPDMLRKIRKSKKKDKHAQEHSPV